MSFCLINCIINRTKTKFMSTANWLRVCIACWFGGQNHLRNVSMRAFICLLAWLEWPLAQRWAQDSHQRRRRYFIINSGPHVCRRATRLTRFSCHCLHSVSSRVSGARVRSVLMKWRHWWPPLMTGISLSNILFIISNVKSIASSSMSSLNSVKTLGFCKSIRGWVRLLSRFRSSSQALHQSFENVFNDGLTERCHQWLNAVEEEREEREWKRGLPLRRAKRP